MRIYKGNDGVDKSWSVRLISQDVEGEECTTLVAVDTMTGEWVANLIFFHPCGRVNIVVNAYNRIAGAGYNPHEHGNTFTKEGYLHVGHNAGFPSEWMSTRQVGGTPYEISPEDVRLKKEE